MQVSANIFANEKGPRRVPIRCRGLAGGQTHRCRDRSLGGERQLAALGLVALGDHDRERDEAEGSANEERDVRPGVRTQPEGGAVEHERSEERAVLDVVLPEEDNHENCEYHDADNGHVVHDYSFPCTAALDSVKASNCRIRPQSWIFPDMRPDSAHLNYNER